MRFQCPACSRSLMAPLSQFFEEEEVSALSAAPTPAKPDERGKDRRSHQQLEPSTFPAVEEPNELLPRRRRRRYALPLLAGVAVATGLLVAWTKVNQALKPALDPDDEPPPPMVKFFPLPPKEASALSRSNEEKNIAEPVKVERTSTDPAKVEPSPVAPAPKPADRADPVRPAAGAPREAEEIAAEFLKRLNAFRKDAELGPLVLDPVRSRACTAHARYLALNADHPAVKGKSAFSEDPQLPGYSEEGNRVARACAVYLGDPLAGCQQIMARPFFRIHVLNQDLKTVGFGVAEGGAQGTVSVLDVYSGAGSDQVIVYPAPAQTFVLTAYWRAGERPDPLPDRPDKRAGFPITVQFPGHLPVRNVSASLKDEDGKLVDAWLWTPEKPVADPPRQHNTICLIAKEPLKPKVTYVVRMSAVLGDEAWNKTWSFTTGIGPEVGDNVEARTLERVNFYRKNAGLKAVELDPALSKACAAHARYLVQNSGAPSTQGLGVHEESKDLPGYTEEGKRAAKASNIATIEPISAVDAWMATLYHRVPMLDANLQKVGVGYAYDPGRGWISVLDVHSNRGNALQVPATVYPVDGQEEVPLAFPSNEVPDPLPDAPKNSRAGYPLTAIFYPTVAVRKVTAKLSDPSGQEVEVWLSTPEKPANPKYPRHQANTVCLIPKAPLKPRTTYKVALTGVAGGDKFKKTWSFTTGGEEKMSLEFAGQVLERVNFHRRAAGLEPVTLDPWLSQGCAAHANYLSRNATNPAKIGTTLAAEDPDLPGFSEEGLQAARVAATVRGFVTPAGLVDNMMSLFFHRLPMLQPDLKQIGFGGANDAGKGWVCVLDVSRGRGGDRTVIFPAHQQQGVPPSIPGAGPDRLPGNPTQRVGYPITVTFPTFLQVKNVRATLTDGSSKDVDLWQSTPDKPSDPRWQKNTLCLVPREGLRPDTAYTVKVHAVVGGKDWSRAWSFTTGKE